MLKIDLSIQEGNLLQWAVEANNNGILESDLSKYCSATLRPTAVCGHIKTPVSSKIFFIVSLDYY